MSKVKMLSKTLKSQGTFISFHSAKMEFENGKTADWDYVHHNGAAAMIAETKEGTLLMIRQYRPGADREILEIPAGGLNASEDPLNAAIRELREETGAVVKDAEPLMMIQPSPAYNDEKVFLFYGKVDHYTDCEPDENEYVTVEQHTLTSLLSMIQNGELHDAKTVAGIMAYYLKTKK